MNIIYLPKRYKIHVEFFVKQLFSRQIIPYLTFRFSFRSNLGFFWGYTEIDDQYELTNKLRHFHIIISNKQPKDQVLYTLAHELVHCKQYCYDNLCLDGAGWKREIIYNKEYHELPWEIEAEQLSYKLVEMVNQC